MILDAKDLSPTQKSVIEGLLGRRVLQNEAISLRAIEAPTLSDDQRHELASKLRKYFAEVDARRMTGSSEEEDEILNEAMQSVRPGYRPRR